MHSARHGRLAAVARVLAVASAWVTISCGGPSGPKVTPPPASPGTPRPSGAAPGLYSCGTPTHDHCYGVAHWEGEPAIGFLTEFVAVPLRGGDAFVDDEGWLIDRATGGTTSWIEAGEISGPANSSTDYFFWAQEATGRGYFFHYLGALVASDFSRWTSLLVKNTVLGQWLIVIGHPTGTSPPALVFAAAPAGNFMSPTAVAIGQELAGGHGASAGATSFVDNWSIDGGQARRKTSGAVISDDPPIGKWLVAPERSPGGSFQTRCC